MRCLYFHDRRYKLLIIFQHSTSILLAFPFHVFQMYHGIGYVKGHWSISKARNKHVPSERATRNELELLRIHARKSYDMAWRFISMLVYVWSQQAHVRIAAKCCNQQKNKSYLWKQNRIKIILIYGVTNVDKHLRQSSKSELWKKAEHSRWQKSLCLCFFLLVSSTESEISVKELKFCSRTYHIVYSSVLCVCDA